MQIEVKKKEALYFFKEGLKCGKINKIRVLAKERTEFLDYMQYCKNLLTESLKDCKSHFTSANAELYDMFCEYRIDCAVSEELEQFFKQELQHWNRLFEYLLSERYEFLADYSYFTKIADKQVSSSCLVFKKDGAFVLAKIKAGKSKLSQNARKFEYKKENDFDLLTMVREAQASFSNDVECSLFYLRNKNDTSSELVEYNYKQGSIFTLSSKEFREVSHEYLTKVAEDYKELYTSTDVCEKCKFGLFCDLKNHKLIAEEQEQVVEPSEDVVEDFIVLSEEQERIVSKGLGNFLVSAVPGAGKTRILIERVKMLLLKNVLPKKIMLITFTNVAMNEIKSRLRGVKNGEYVYVTTFNRFGQSILSEYYTDLGYEFPPVIITKYDSYLFLLDVIKELGIETNLKYVFSEFGMMRKLYSVIVENAKIDEGTGLPEEILDKIYEIRGLFYHKLHKHSLITYDMQITEAIRLLRGNDALRLAYISKFDYIMVDEYQDSDDKNAALVNLVANNNVMVVGDEDQAIYGFKGANLDNFLEFDGKKYFMKENYRSSGSVADVANALISKNLQRLDSGKRIVPKLDIQGEVRLVPGERCIDKLPFIVRDLKKEGYEFSDIAVVARTHSLLKGANQTLRWNAINTVYGAENLIESFEFKILYCFLDSYLNADTESLMVVCSYLRDLDENYDEGVSYFDMFAELSQGIETEVFSDLIDNIADVLGNKEHVLYTKLKEHCELYGLYDLNSLFRYMYGLKVTNDNIPVPIVNDSGVTLLTAHAAKGSEYKVVIVLRAEKFKARTVEEVEEERRLLYVTLTRAKEKLFITYEKEDGFVDELQAAVVS